MRRFAVFGAPEGRGTTHFVDVFHRAALNDGVSLLAAAAVAHNAVVCRGDVIEIMTGGTDGADGIGGTVVEKGHKAGNAAFHGKFNEQIGFADTALRFRSGAVINGSDENIVADSIFAFNGLSVQRAENAFFSAEEAAVTVAVAAAGGKGRQHQHRHGQKQYDLNSFFHLFILLSEKYGNEIGGKNHNTHQHGDTAKEQHRAGGDIFYDFRQRVIFIGTEIHQVFQSGIDHFGNEHQPDEKQQNRQFHPGDPKQDAEEKGQHTHDHMDAEIAFFPDAVFQSLAGVAEAFPKIRGFFHRVTPRAER